MRVAPAIELTSVARLQLEKLSRRRTTPVRVEQRSRIVLLAADGMQDKQIAQRIGFLRAWRLFGEAGSSSRVSAVR
jgi:hypothetical protein